MVNKIFSNTYDATYFVLISLVVSIALVFQLLAASYFSFLCFDSEQILMGEWWRLFSGHMIHVSWQHFVLNMLGVIIVFLLINKFINAYLALGFIFFSMLFVSLMLLIFQTELEWYAGFSGILHGIFALAALFFVFGDGGEGIHKRQFFLLWVLVLKLVWEHYFGAMPGTGDWIGAPVITVAHLYGALSGLCFFVLIRLLVVLNNN